ncbi:MAG: methyltransferase domain-containing protein [Chloroflexia bacterium]|nr:methyltransferase domain-containing protein [Chloroflexia bacterium]
MNHDDHVRLIAGGIDGDAGGEWADLGAGAGAFSLALRDLAGSGTVIHAVDRDASALQELRQEAERRFPGTALHLIQADMTAPLALPPLDGIIAANAIHYVADQVALLDRWRRYLKPAGRLILVEYDSDHGNRWVPYPVSFAALPALARRAGFGEPTLLGTRPSRYLERIYAAVMVPVPVQQRHIGLRSGHDQGRDSTNRLG